MVLANTILAESQALPEDEAEQQCYPRCAKTADTPNAHIPTASVPAFFAILAIFTALSFTNEWARKPIRQPW